MKPARIPPIGSEAEHAAAFKALGHPGRLQVFFFLVKARREVAVGEIQSGLALPAPTVSHHLDALRRVGLIRSRREERHIFSTVAPEKVTSLVRLLTACC
jgi:DNA-binding transcriptional ArsR family regulator